MLRGSPSLTIICLSLSKDIVIIIICIFQKPVKIGYIYKLIQAIIWHLTININQRKIDFTLTMKETEVTAHKTQKLIRPGLRVSGVSACGHAWQCCLRFPVYGFFLYKQINTPVACLQTSLSIQTMMTPSQTTLFAKFIRTFSLFGVNPHNTAT